jgi:hypothetical protein
VRENGSGGRSNCGLLPEVDLSAEDDSGVDSNCRNHFQNFRFSGEELNW